MFQEKGRLIELWERRGWQLLLVVRAGCC